MTATAYTAPLRLCPSCRERRMTGFNPKQGDVVRHVDRQAGPLSDLVVIERRGDLVAVRPLGHPDQPTRTYPVGALTP